MSSSEQNSKIDLLDTEKAIATKIRSAFCEEGSIVNNGILSFIKMVLFQIPKISANGYTVHRDDKHGGNLTFETYQEIEAKFVDKTIHPLDLKASVTKSIQELLAPIRQAFEKDEKLIELIKQSYCQ